MLARRLRGIGVGGSFTDMGYTMGAAETAWWADMAALLDPAAWSLIETNDTDVTVATGEVYYLQEGWNLDATGAGSEWFHRGGDVRDAFPISAGTTFGTDQDPAGPSNLAHLYYARPSLVTAGDSRYTTDPRGLYFERLRRLATELPQYKIGVAISGSGQTTATFPTDFDNGMILHVSSQDIAWVIPRSASGDSGLITQMEISDIDPIRVAAVCLIPFVRTQFPSILAQGANLATGRTTITYAKLPADW
jgi:hypothetical protein